MPRKLENAQNICSSTTRSTCVELHKLCTKHEVHKT